MFATITTHNGQIVREEDRGEPRCSNCGIISNEAKTCIAGGYLCEEEWACCEECYNEMVEKGCCFEELGNNVYRGVQPRYV
ncbi:hypothetical protein [Bacillus clarus]|uniref:Uncharacterized protein n=1 Tax=Bacillus clarus TaxID=2338372 RepID=A0A090Z2Z4_9BACI|nr:hypothetical protein [Bacillus clarus]KFN04743.1 hypothetical protein DJ93_5922 [Bacillus clarus]